MREDAKVSLIQDQDKVTHAAAPVVRSVVPGQKSLPVPAKKFRIAAAGFIWLAVLAVCAALRPLQMDEVFQLIGVRTPHLASVFSWLRVNPASVPGEYLVEWALVRAAGTSAIVARLPSLAAWALASFAMVRAGSRAGVRAAAMLLFVTAVTPILFRYAIEGRPYMPAFCMTAFATLELLALVAKTDTRPRLTSVCLYAVLLAAGPMIQGTAVTVTLGHALFVLTDRSLRTDRVRQTMLASAIAASLLLPVMWSLAMRDAWAEAIAKNGYTFGLSFHAAFGFLKDVTGGGAVCTGLLAVAAAWGFLGADMPRQTKILMGIIVPVTICGALASDGLAGYFVSPRQAIYCLVGLIVPACAGWERLRARHALFSWLALAVFTAVALGRDVSVVRSRENWMAASRMARRAVVDGFCLQPASDLNAPLELYSFFDASLAKARCQTPDMKVGLVSSTYTPPAERNAAVSALVKRGFIAAGRETTGGSTLERFTLPPAAH